MIAAPAPRWVDAVGINGVSNPSRVAGTAAGATVNAAGAGATGVVGTGVTDGAGADIRKPWVGGAASPPNRSPTPNRCPR